MFTLRGTINRGPATVSWDDGELSGSIAWRVRAAVRELDPEPIALTPTGPFYDPAEALDDPLGALALLRDCADDPHAVEPLGDVPELPAAPEGSVQ